MLPETNPDRRVGRNSNEGENIPIGLVKGNYWGLIIGIDDYKNMSPQNLRQR
ncbi:MAG: hypothetical protein HQK79_06940 [Desulfobacterales bacterium]|nr:hypothetical protein [Desulfobacterales bacterium]MBF0397532.1 hypothetical protein [Desulfobacterales bacterium]